MRKIIVKYFVNALFLNSYINVYENRRKYREHIFYKQKKMFIILPMPIMIFTIL